MDRENVVGIYVGILFGHKKEGNPATCNNIEDIMFSETSHTERDKCMISLTCGI